MSFFGYEEDIVVGFEFVAAVKDFPFQLKELEHIGWMFL